MQWHLFVLLCTDDEECALAHALLARSCLLVVAGALLPPTESGVGIRVLRFIRARPTANPST